MARNELKKREVRWGRPAGGGAAHPQSGFTLLEMLIVISLTVLIMIGATGLFFTAIVANTKKEVISAVKLEGDYAIGQMEFMIRNAIALVPDPSITGGTVQCSPGMTSITFKSLDNGITTFYTAANGQIASRSGTTTPPLYLTSSAVTLGSSPNDLEFDCQQSGSNHQTYVKVHFTLTKNASLNYNAPNTVTQNFYTSVNIRSF